MILQQAEALLIGRDVLPRTIRPCLSPNGYGYADRDGDVDEDGDGGGDEVIDEVIGYMIDEVTDAVIDGVMDDSNADDTQFR